MKPIALRDKGIIRVLRGGSWEDSRLNAYASSRGREKTDVRYSYLGFRPCLEMR